jgi:hypothetical protein
LSKQQPAATHLWQKAMPRKKSPDPEELLTHPVILRVTKTAFERLEKIQTESNCGSVGEVARKILSNVKIQLFYKDISMNGSMKKKGLIRKELNAIGVLLTSSPLAITAINKENTIGQKIALPRTRLVLDWNLPRRH